jgi:hypothetical protein
MRVANVLSFETMSAKGQVRKADEHKSIAVYCSMAAACVTPGRWPDPFSTYRPASNPVSIA